MHLHLPHRGGICAAGCRILGVLAALALTFTAARTLADEPLSSADRPPNILFLLTDDQRADTVGALGNPHIQTPHLDKLVRQGFHFTNAYCLGGNSPAVCLPSRNMLLSGRAYFRFGAQASGDDPNLPRSFRSAGYVTYHHGKLGNTAREIHKQFDISKYLDDEQARRSGEPGQQIVDEAIAYLEQHSGERPFCMYLAFASPHDPRVASDRYLAQYTRQQIPLPKNFLPEHPFDNGELKVRDEQLAAWPRTEDEIRRHLHEYYAVISGLDHHIGRLLAALDRLELAENTLVVFTSDQGLAVGSHGLMGKQNLYDHSMKVPLVLRGPGIPVGQSQALVYLLDVFPTLCELAGVPVPDSLDGKSFAPLLRGAADDHHDSLLLAYRDVQRAVRDERFKLIVYPQADRYQLFDLWQDPDEAHDLSGHPDQLDRIAKLRARMRVWQLQLTDPLASSSSASQ